MEYLKTMEYAYVQGGQAPVYAVAAMPEWKHYDPDNCPAPIREWLKQHYPKVQIELTEFALQYGVTNNGESSISSSVSDIPRPICRLVGFNGEQARDHFLRAWSSPPLETEDSPCEFYFITFDPAKGLPPGEFQKAFAQITPLESAAPA